MAKDLEIKELEQYAGYVMRAKRELDFWTEAITDHDDKEYKDYCQNQLSFWEKEYKELLNHYNGLVVESKMDPLKEMLKEK